MLSGSYNPGSLYLFRRNEDGTFAAGQELAGEDGKPLNVGAAAHVSAADWTGDGKLDLVVGNITGEVFLIAHTGSGEALSFAAPQRLKDAIGEITVAADAGPHVVDWDGDGKLDLLVGDGAGEVRFYRNVGEKGSPELDAHRVLLPAAGHGMAEPGQEPKVPWGTRLKLHAADYNDDGKLDLLVGDFRMEAQAKDPLTAAQETRRAELLQEYNKLVQKYQPFASAAEAGKLNAEETAEYEALRDQLTKLMEELAPLQPNNYTYHGNVWVFLRQ